MAKQGIELILARQLAGSLAMPCFVFDAPGALVFYNEPAELILGQRFEETGEMPLTELACIFATTNARGVPLRGETLPLQMAALTRRPIHKRFWIRGLDGVRRHIASSAFPLLGAGDRLLGVMSIFPELGATESAARTPGVSPVFPATDPSQSVSAPGSPGTAARTQKEIEIILTRHLASYLATPMVIADPQGTLIYFNRAAETIVGRPFEETGEMPATVWMREGRPSDAAGRALPLRRLPLMVALTHRQPAQSRLWIRGLDSVRRQIEAIAIPIVGQAERFLGGMALFWQVDE